MRPCTIVYMGLFYHFNRGNNMSNNNLRYIPRTNRQHHIEYTFNNRMSRMQISKLAKAMHIIKQTIKWWVR